MTGIINREVCSEENVSVDIQHIIQHQMITGIQYLMNLTKSLFKFRDFSFNVVIHFKLNPDDRNTTLGKE
jgi:hypothetical protein